MTYVAPCNLPEFRQTVPREGNWDRVPDPRYPCQWRYRERTTGEQVLVPAIWYNDTPQGHAKGLRFYADRSEETARRLAQSPEPYRRRDAEGFQRRADNLRKMAEILDASTASTAGQVDAEIAP